MDVIGLRCEDDGYEKEDGYKAHKLLVNCRNDCRNVCLRGGTVEAQAAVVTKNVNLNVSNSIAGIGNPSPNATDKWTGSRVYLGEKLWRILDSDNASTGATGQAFLFSEDFLATGKAYHNSFSPITWKDCQLRKDLNGEDNNGGIYSNTFTNDIEKNAIITSHIGNPDNGSADGGDDTYDKLFLLSLDEVQNSSYGMPKTEAGSTNYNKTRGNVNGDDMSSWWWLRSPGDDFNNAAADVDYNGYVYSTGTDVNKGNGSARPALNLMLSSVLFSSANKPANFEKTTDGSAIDIWKLTLKDGNNTFAASRTDAGGLASGTSVTVDITGFGSKSSSDYDMLSVMLVDSNNTVLAYGPTNCSVSEGEKTFTIPTYTGTASKLYIFGEKLSGGNLTDYASNMVDITTKAPNPPTPTPSEDNHTNNDSSNNDNQPSSSKKNKDTYINPLTWSYPANQAGSMCLIEHQGELCNKAFRESTPAGFKEALSFNLLTHEKINSEPKHGTLTLTIPQEYQKSGRSFVIMGIDKAGKVHHFADTDTNPNTVTINIEGFEGYAFSVIYTDGAAVPKALTGQTGTGGGVYIVKEGDVLSSIAKKLGVSRKYLTDKNGLADPNKIKIGQKLSY